MITNSFDDRSPAKINPNWNNDAPRVEAVIATFSNMIEKNVVENYACEKVGQMRMAHGSTDVYCLEYHGKKIRILQNVGGRACLCGNGGRNTGDPEHR